MNELTYPELLLLQKLVESLMGETQTVPWVTLVSRDFLLDLKRKLEKRIKNLEADYAP